MSETSILDLERRAIEFHERYCAEAASLWLDGLNLLLRGIDPVDGIAVKGEEQRILIALVIRAWNSLYCVRDLALKGYHSQALNILRTVVEDWATYIYLRTYPDRYVQFAIVQDPRDKSTEPPSFQEMMKDFESKNGLKRNQVIRDWIERLHPYSHASGSGILMAVTSTPSGLYYHLGSCEDKDAFERCAWESVIAIVELLEIVNDLRSTMGAPGYFEWHGYRDRVIAWQNSITARNSS